MFKVEKHNRLNCLCILNIRIMSMTLFCCSHFTLSTYLSGVSVVEVEDG